MKAEPFRNMVGFPSGNTPTRSYTLCLVCVCFPLPANMMLRLPSREISRLGAPVLSQEYRVDTVVRFDLCSPRIELFHELSNCG